MQMLCTSLSLRQHIGGLSSGVPTTRPSRVLDMVEKSFSLYCFFICIESHRDSRSN